MKIMLQIAIVFGVCLAGEGIASLLPFSFPASVISLVLLFVLLLLQIIKVEQIQKKADFLLQNMAFFFIPAGVSIMENVGFVKGSILPLVFICLVSTILTFAATAFTVKAVVALQDKWNGRKTHE